MFIGCSRSVENNAHELLMERLREFNAESVDAALQVYRHGDLTVAGKASNGVSIDISGNSRCVVMMAGRPSWALREYEHLSNRNGIASSIVHAFDNHGMELLEHLRGVFAVSIYDVENHLVHLATDRFGIIPVYFTVLGGGGVAWGSTIRVLRSIQMVQTEIDPQSIFHYLYFHMVPSPNSIYRSVRKLCPGEITTIGEQEITQRRYWSPQFSESDVDFQDMASRVRRVLSESVRDCANDNPGTFLSGGLDSSTVTGLLAKERNGDVDAYSIGFTADGYDEIEYARTAARHFGVRHHIHYITPNDVVATIPKIVMAYDEPFGNSSAVPTYVCANFAQENGTSILLAGDGGDELFGGNERYVKQQIFEYYFRLPIYLRKILETADEKKLLASWVPYLGKFYRYVTQAKIPLPDRLQTYNLLERTQLSEVLTEDMLERIDQELTIRLQREEYFLDTNVSPLNRMLRLDWRFTLADNDLRKVNIMTSLAGIEVRYPMLADPVVAIANQIPSRLKIARHTLRYFYKEAFKEILPASIITKSKHGFGLPFGVWMLDHPQLHALAYDSIYSLKNRGIISPQYLDNLLNQHRHEHAAYYGEMIWVLMILELWLQKEA